VRDRVVQAALKLVLEPIWEADFQPCSYGFGPGRRARDAIAELHHLASHSYEWVLDGDITACFDELSHSAMLERVRERIADRRVLGLVKAFLKAGILSEDGAVRDTVTGTPQGGILSPAQQPGPVGAGRAHHRARAGQRPVVGAGTSTTPGTTQLPDRAVCG
jgi:RNA-directed DNA polymerase